MNTYMIQNRETKEYSSGGSNWNIEFRKFGKCWRTLCHIKSHLSKSNQTNYRTSTDILYNNCDLVEYELVEIDRTSISDIVSSIREKEVEDQNKSDKARCERNEMAEKNLYMKLKEKYE